MAFVVTNKWLDYCHGTVISAATDIRMLVFTGTVPSTATIRAFDFVQNAIDSSLNEATASGYSRQDLTISYTPESAGGNNLVISATAPVLTAVASGQTFVAVGYFVETAASPTDSNRVLIGIDVPTPPTIDTNDANITLPALSLTVTGS